jgi:hypothetical protein
LFARFVGVTSDVNLKKTKELSGPDKEIFLVGDVSYDKFKPSSTKREETLKKLNIPSQSRIVCFMSFPADSNELGTTDGQVSQEIHQEIINSILEIPKQIDNVVVLVKPHPVENISRYEQIIQTKGIGDKIKLVADMESYEVINAAELTMCVQSTTGMETILMGKKLIYLDWIDQPDIMGFKSNNVACVVRNHNELIEGIIKTLEDERYKKLLTEKRMDYLKERYCFPLHESGTRCISHIKRIVDSAG